MKLTGKIGGMGVDLGKPDNPPCDNCGNISCSAYQEKEMRLQMVEESCKGWLKLEKRSNQEGE